MKVFSITQKLVSQCFFKQKTKKLGELVDVLLLVMGKLK